jgi:hypothetical protein
VASLTLERGRRQWCDQIPGEGGTPTVGAVRRATWGVARGVLRREDGGGETFKWHRGKQREGGNGVGATRGGRRSMRRGVGLDWWGTAWAARQLPETARSQCARAARHVRTGEASGSLTHGTRLVAGERERGAWHVDRPEKKEVWAEPKEQEHF